jgi:DNA repair exonuclease SbcCD nuclease subunit
MKIALITDTHFGAREGRGIFHDYYNKFYTNTFFPTLKEEGIDTVLHLGDMFDRRKYIDYYSLKRSREYFFDPLQENEIKMYALVGNHDIALRNSLEINSPELLLTEYDNITPITNPSTLNIDGTSFLMVPWICSDNYDISMIELKSSKADVCCGHFEISGFSMYKGMESHEGFSTDAFSRFDMVFSGHYHHRSSNGRIHYLGNPYELSWNDYNDPRGFHIFDTEDQSLVFIENPYTMHERIEYNNGAIVDFESLRDKFVKVVTVQKGDYYNYDMFIDKVMNAGAYDVKIMEQVLEMSSEEMDESISLEDTLSIINHYIHHTEIDVDKTKLENCIKLLYTEAINTSF